MLLSHLKHGKSDGSTFMSDHLIHALPAICSSLACSLPFLSYILLSYPDHFLTLGLQFGFKQKMSTSLCTGSIKNIVSRYMHENSVVNFCFLDASKAFDPVNHKILFQRLLVSCASYSLPFILVQRGVHVC